MATHSSTLAWKIPWTEEPGRRQSMGSQRVRHDWATELNWTELKPRQFSLIFSNSGNLKSLLYARRRKWQPTPVLLPGKFHEWRSLVGYIPWCRKGSDTTEQFHFLSFYSSFWRRKWQPTPVFLPRESHGQRGLVGFSLWGCKESDTTKQLTHIW